MKKSMALLCALCLLLGLFSGCGSKSNETSAPVTEPTVAPAEP